MAYNLLYSSYKFIQILSFASKVTSELPFSHNLFFLIVNPQNYKCIFPIFSEKSMNGFQKNLTQCVKLFKNIRPIHLNHTKAHIIQPYFLLVVHVDVFGNLTSFIGVSQTRVPLSSLTTYPCYLRELQWQPSSCVLQCMIME